MKNKKVITSTFLQISFSELNENDQKLISNAISSLNDAYAPYSGFLVGASVLLDNGEIISANNQENVAYPSGLCAERVAIYYAGAKFPSIGIKTIAITAKSKKFEIKDIISPCGACRQSIAEYEVKQEGNIRILLHQSDNSVLIVESISELLPFMFKSQDLKNY